MAFRSGYQPAVLKAGSFMGTRRLLVERGYSPSCFPRCVGGDYEYTSFYEWIRMRLSLEGPMASSVLSLVAPEAQLVGNNNTRPRRARLTGYEPRAASERGAVYSKRHYHRRKMGVQILRDEHERQERINSALKQENARLEGLLSQARQIVVFAGGAVFNTSPMALLPAPVPWNFNSGQAASGVSFPPSEQQDTEFPLL